MTKNTIPAAAMNCYNLIGAIIGAYASLPMAKTTLRDPVKTLSPSIVVAASFIFFSAGSNLLGDDRPNSDASASVAADAGNFAAQVDQSLANELDFSDHSDEFSPLVGDETFLRRVQLDLLGELPSAEQIQTFVASSDPEKRSKLVQDLLNDNRFGENWGRYWRDVIYYRKSEERGNVGYQPTADYIAAAFNENRPWSYVAIDMITAKGAPEENGATGLILAHLGKPEETAAEVSRVFLGIQIQCGSVPRPSVRRLDARAVSRVSSVFSATDCAPQQEW